MTNYDFCAAFTGDLVRSRQSAVLDYGCGNGQVVGLLRDRGYPAFGCDLFYAGGDQSHAVDPALFQSGAILEMQDGRIPFPDQHFDLVITNQVFEHVPDLDAALTEIARVLKPGGAMLALFPDRHTWREGHCGVPFLHWFPKQSSPRILYAAVFRMVGFGHFKHGKGVLQWSREFCAWLDQWTHYRSYPILKQHFDAHFVSLDHHEAYWLDQRFGDRLRGLPRRLPRFLKTFITRKWAGVVLTCRKAGQLPPQAPSTAAAPAASAPAQGR